MKKRILALCLAFLMVTGTLPVQTFADEGAPADVTLSQSVTEPVAAAETEPCPTCGVEGCTSAHLNWCDVCEKDDCGVDHTAVAEPCPICGVEGCEKTHIKCTVCSEYDCTLQHVYCDVCEDYDCGVDHTAVPMVSNDIEAPDVDYSHDIDKYAVMNESVVSMTTREGENGMESDFWHEDFTEDAIFRIVDWQWDADAEALWYQVVFHRGGVQGTFASGWPSEPWVLQTDSEGDALRFVELCDICGNPDCDEDHVQPEPGCGCCEGCTGAEDCTCGCEDCDYYVEPELPDTSCDICGEVGCTVIHFFCEFCEDYDCGESHLVCPACGEIDCEETHVFCGKCGDYDCGLTHVDSYKPATAPVIPVEPVLTPGEDISLVDESGDPITSAGLYLQAGEKISISAWAEEGLVTSRRWQIGYDDGEMHWVNIRGQTGKGILVSPAMVLSLIDIYGEAYLRCVANVGGETRASAAIPVTVMDTASVYSRKLLSSRNALSLLSVPVAETGTEYTITIKYLYYGTNQQAATPSVARVKAGQPYTLDIPAPVVPGYAQDPNSGYTKNGDTSRIYKQYASVNGDQEVNIFFVPDYVNVKIIHHRQTAEGSNYDVYEVENRDDILKTGEKIGPGYEKTYNGYYALIYDQTLEVAADGSTVVNIYYDRVYYLVNLNLNGGYGVDPIYARHGSSINASALVPQRTGYTFARWEPALPATVPMGGSEHTAQWTESGTGFTVAFWYENANDTNYTFVGSVAKSGTTGAKVNGVDYKSEAFTGRDDEHFTYETADTNVEIKADGTTVVNVKFSRNSYTLTYLTPICTHTHTGSCCNITEHTHTNACCSLQHTSHDNSCCSIPYHTEHTTGCVANGIKKGTTYIPEGNLDKAVPNRYNGVWTTMEYLGATRYYVWFDGSWYRTADGNNGKDPLVWNCMNQGRNYTHDHTSGCDCTKYHDHSSGRNNSCNLANCSNGGKAHTHGSGCNTNNCTHLAYINAKDPYRCGCSFESDDRWTVYTSSAGIYGSKSFKYQQDVSAFHAAMDDHRWCPGVGTGFTSASEGPYGKGAAVGTFSSMHGCDVVFYQSARGGNPYFFTFWLESTNGTSGTRDYNGHNFEKSSAVFTPRMGAVGYKGDYQAGRPFGFADFEAWSSDELGGKNVAQLKAPNGSFGGEYTYYNFYYIRKTYNLTYFNGSTQVATRTMKYDEVLTETTYNLRNLTMTSPYGTGYEFAGWYLDDECSVPVNWGSDRMPDGGMALYADWEPVEHTVRTYRNEAAVGTGTPLNTYKVLHGNTVPENERPKNPDPPATGMTFVSWFYRDENGEEKAYNFSMPVNRDMDLYAVWNGGSMAYGTVYYKLENGTEIAPAATIAGDVGKSKTYSAKFGNELNSGYTSGYFPDAASKNITFAADNPNAVTFWYKEMEEVPYTVQYAFDGVVDASKTKTGTSKQGSITEVAPYCAGYSVDALSKTLVLSTVGQDNVLTFQYTTDTVHAPVRVTHYIQNVDGTGYIVSHSVNYTGVQGEVQTISPDTMVGFVHNSAKDVNNGKVLPATGLSIELYYDRSSYPYTFRFVHSETDGDVEFEGSSVSGTARYGSKVEQAAKQFPGYRLLSASTQTINILTETDETAVNNVATFRYAEDTVTITYRVADGVGGTVTVPSNTLKAVTGTQPSSTAEAKPGYRFEAWYSDQACTQKIATTELLEPAKKDGAWEAATYFAKFEANVYEAKFVANGGSVSPTTTTFNTADGLDLPTPSRDGYIFVGWKVTEAGEGGNWTLNQVYTDVFVSGKYGNVTMTAQWKCTIRYEAGNGGSVEPGSETIMTDGTPQGSVAEAESGYEFLGWYDNEDRTGAVLSKDRKFVPAPNSSGLYETATYYAVFAPVEYDATFDLGYDTSDPATKTYTIESGLNMPNPTRTGYDFLEWKVTTAGGNWNVNSEYNAGAAVSGKYGNVTLTAQWEEKTSIFTYLAVPENDGLVKLGTNGATAVSVNETVNVVTGIASGATAVVDSSKPGYQFSGWYTYKVDTPLQLVSETNYFQPQKKLQQDGVTMAYEGETYYAAFKPVVYTATFKMADNDTAPSTKPFTIEQSLTLSTQEREGYTFKGWKVTTADGNWVAGTQYAPATEAIEAGKYGNVTFTAQWECTITYVAEVGGSVSRNTETIMTNSASTPQGSVATANPGYEFLGWFVGDATTPVSTNPDFVPEKGADGLYATATYTAKFKLSVVDLTIVATGETEAHSYIFEVEGTPYDTSYGTICLQVVLTESKTSITIKSLPVGKYTVTEKNGWSWRQYGLDAQEITLNTTEGATVTFGFGDVEKIYWLNGYSYGSQKKKKGDGN
ncbi:MAG: InlB B-repeat-containing protein [Clostridia bacterium]|nr:InlB B-repeat-containing protein [Clostridia bacterium]